MLRVDISYNKICLDLHAHDGALIIEILETKYEILDNNGMMNLESP